MAAIKRELQVKFSTTGDGEVTRSIVKVDDALKGTEASSGAASKSIGDLSESIDKGLENSVGKAFKATDRLNSIVGQVTGAIGLATLAVGGVVAIYNKLTASSNAVGAGHDTMTLALKGAGEAFERGAKAADDMRKAEERLAAQIGVRLALLDSAIRKQAVQNDETIKNAEISVDAIRATVEAQRKQRDELLKVADAQQKALQKAATASNVVASEVQARSNALVATRAQIAEIEQSIKANELLVGSQQAAIRTAEAWNKGLVAQGKAAEGLSAATATSPTSVKASLDAAALSFAPVIAATSALAEAARDLASAIGPELSAAYAQSLDGLAEALGAVPVDTLAGALGIGEGDESALFAIPAAVAESSAALQAANAAAESFGNTAAQSLGQAAAAALVYGESFSEVAAQAVAGLAAQAVSEAAFQSAKALAYLGVGLFTGSPAAFAAASQAAASAAAFGAIAAVTVPVARATGSAGGGGGSGSGVPAGPSSRDVGRTDDTGGGGETIIINMGNQRVFATERDVGSAVARSLNEAGRGRGRPRIRQRAIGRA